MEEAAGAPARLRVLLRHLLPPQPPGLAADRTRLTSFPTAAQATSVKYPTKYRYTLDNSILSPEQRLFYEENGYLVIKNLVSSEDIERFRDEFENICKKEVKIPGLVIMRDIVIAKSEFIPDQKAITKVQDFQEDEELFRYCKLPQRKDWMQKLAPAYFSPSSMLGKYQAVFVHLSEYSLKIIPNS